ncbi:cell division protein Fic [Clostridia bacterium]|nr:cell division protein Fic [Clostridia bacterium]
MDYGKLLEKRDFYLANKHLIPREIEENYDANFDIEYTHNSTAIEGNTLTLAEVKLILEDNVSIGDKNMREIYEVVNHGKAYKYVKKTISEGAPLDEAILKDIHALLCENIMIGGVYRDMNVYIRGAIHVPPAPLKMYEQIKVFYMNLQAKKEELNAIELAAWTHAEFVKIHPFSDGNGRTSRLIMNYQLMANEFLPVFVALAKRRVYFEKLEEYAVSGNLEPFAEFVYELEYARLDWYNEQIKLILT